MKSKFLRLEMIFVFAVLSALFLAKSTQASWQIFSSYPHPELSKPNGIDLDVTYISRSSMYNRYSVWYTSDGRPFLEPGTENNKRWPDQGELVTFTAHFINKGTVASGNFSFKWFIDDVEVVSGAHSSLSAGQEGTEIYQWTWAHQVSGERLLGTHTVKFVVDPNNVVSETYETNNRLEDRTDALSLILIITPQMYNAFELPANSQIPYSAEDWLQKQIAAMNEALKNSVYSAAPSGILDRVRIDKIVIAADNIVDATEDGGWFVNSDYRVTSGYYHSANDIDGGLIHELSHQLGLIDMYNLDVPLEIPQILDNLGNPVQIDYSTRFFTGLMNNPGIDPPFYDEHSALALNSSKGYRRGYYGEYLYDISNQSYFRVLDNSGVPAPNVEIKLYQRSSDQSLYGGLFGTINNIPEITVTTDSQGKALLTNRSAGSPLTTNTGHVLHDNPLGPINVVGANDQFLVKLTYGLHEEFLWLNITDLNIARWKGSAISSVIDISSHVPALTAPLPPINLTGIQEYGLVKINWAASSSSNITGYNIYRSDGNQYPYQRIASGISDLSFQELFNNNLAAAIYVVTGVDSQGLESRFSNPFYAFRLVNPAAIGVNNQNARLVLDPQNGYALLSQSQDNVFRDTRQSVHYHLENSRFLAEGVDGRIIVSHPGDGYSLRHSVRILDKDFNPTLEFGQQGYGAGEFQTPTGVAFWGTPCTISGTYSQDLHSTLLLHFDGNHTGADGETGAAYGTTFVTGKYSNAVKIDSNDYLTYSSAGNINRTQGAIEFWVRTHWNGNDYQSYTFFEIGDSWFNRMRIVKDGINNLRFMVWDSATEYGVAYNISDWQSESWHHVAATWSGHNIALYIDGVLRDSSSSANVPDVLSGSFYIGSTTGGNEQANADFDEFRISDIPRIGSSDTCSSRILVADSGNNRIQAFDDFGNFVASYGSWGSGNGQFDNPQSLAVDGNGNVLIVDRGNHRVQKLAFDGHVFSFVQVVSDNFSYPTGIAVYNNNDESYVVVSDTGSNKIKLFSGGGILVREYDGPNGVYSGLFSNPQGVAIDNSGKIIVSDTGNKRVVTIDGAFGLYKNYLPITMKNYSVGY